MGHCEVCKNTPCDCGPGLPKGVLTRLEELQNLEENWDSYGAKKPDTGAIELTGWFLYELQEKTPRVTACPDGSICASFGEIDIIIKESGRIEIDQSDLDDFELADGIAD